MIRTAFFVAFLTSCGVASGQTGLERLPSADGRICSNVMYVCYTNGRGTSEFGTSGAVISIRHSEYPDGTPTAAMETELDGDFNATNYFRFISNETCNDPPCYTYRTKLSVHVTNATRCENITCETEFSGNTTPFGRDLIQWLIPPPSDLKVNNRSMNSATVSWKSGATDCSNIMYEIKTNCGNCSPTIITNNTSITCDNLVIDGECNVTVRSMWDCEGSSEPRMVTVQQYEAIATPTSNSENLMLVIGLSVGLVLGIPTLVLCVVLVIVVVVRHCNKKEKSSNLITEETGFADVVSPVYAVKNVEDVDRREEIPLDELEVNPSKENATKPDAPPSQPPQESPHLKPKAAEGNASASDAPEVSEQAQDNTMFQDTEGNTSQLPLLAHDENNIPAQANPSKVCDRRKKNATKPDAPPSQPLQESPHLKPEATEDNATASDAPEVSKQAQEIPNEPEVTEGNVPASDAHEIPEQAQASPKKLEIAGKNTAGAESSQLQPSPKKPEVAEESTAAVSFTPQQAQSGEEGGEDSMVTSHQDARQRIKSSGSYHDGRDKTPQVSISRGIPDAPGLQTVYHTFNDMSEKSEREPNESLVKQSVSDIAGRNNRMVVDTPSIQESGSSEGINAQPAAQGRTGSTQSGEAEAIPKSPITLNDNGAGESLTVAIIPSAEANKVAVCSPLTLEQRVAATEKEICQLKANEHIAKKERDAAKRERTDLLEEILRLTRELRNMQTQYKTLEKECNAEKSSHQELKIKHASLEKKCKDHSTENERLQEENERIKGQYEKVKRDKEDLERKMKETQEKLMKAEARLKAIDNACQESISEN